jgi:hypothetical protein
MFILDLGSPMEKQEQKRGVKNNLLSYLFLEPQISQNCKLFIFEMRKKKIWANYQRIKELFTQKLSLSSQEYGFGIRDPEKTYSGSRMQGSKRHRIPDPEPQHW